VPWQLASSQVRADAEPPVEAPAKPAQPAPPATPAPLGPAEDKAKAEQRA